MSEQLQTIPASLMERFFILDGMAIAYRAYFAFINRPLINSKGLNTGAIFGFVNTLDKILTKEKPEHIAVAFDTKQPTFRHKAYPEYKATREKMPEDMVKQLPYLKRIVEAYRIPVFELPGWEADDIIGTLARRAEAENIECYLVTPDKDFMQLISERIKMYKPGKSSDAYDIIDIEGVKKKFGVAPEQVIDVLGLMGDQSDNIPGVRGIGEKTAIPLVQQFGSIAGIYEHIDEVNKAGVIKKLLEQKDMAFLSRRLVTIDTDAPVEGDPADLKLTDRDTAALRELFSELELKRFLDKLAEEETGAADVPPNAEFSSTETTEHDYIVTTGMRELHSMVAEILEADEFCFDTETTGLDPLRSELVGLSFSVRSAHAWYVPANAAMKTEEIIEAIRPLFDSGKRIVGQNLKFDLLQLRSYGIETSQPLYDTMIAAYILRPGGNHGMDALAMEHLHYRTLPIEALIGKGSKQSSMSDVPLADIAEYAAEDADITLQLAAVMRPEIEKTGQRKLLEDLEFPLIHVLTDMEHTGVCIDADTLGDISGEMEVNIARATDEIYSMAGEEFKINSTKQLSSILFEKLGLPTGKKTKTGYSTDVSVLESLQGKHEIIDQILLYRQLAKLKSTYVDALPKMVNPRTGRIHTSYKQAVAATGRLSSADPNLQNIPIRTDTGREIRKAFVPEEKDFVLLSADYSQIELRLAAEISGDQGLLEAFAAGEDIHSSTAIRLFDVAASDVTPEMRRRAKTTNFGILYGISAFGLAQRLGISNPDAKDLIEVYFNKYPGINDYIASTIDFAKEHGYVETLLGRRRYIPDINNRNRNIRMSAERTAINAPIQGSAADMIKVAMINIHSEMKRLGLRSRMIMQVHDELVFESPRDEVRSLEEMVVSMMRQALDVRVPIEVDTGSGGNWLEAH